MRKIPITAILAWLVLTLSVMPRTLIAYENPSCDTPFECYEKALEQLQYARELMDAQKETHDTSLKKHKIDNKKLLEQVKQLAEENQRLILQNQQMLKQQQAIISLLEQKTQAITTKNRGSMTQQTELDVNGTVKANLFKSDIKKFHSYNTIEPDGADKDFYESANCMLGTLTPALLNNKKGSDEQAAICACLQDKKGRGWFCWN